MIGTGTLRYAVLGLVASRDEGVHGYRIKVECEAIADEFGGLNYGRVYRLLGEMEAEGALTVADQIQRGRPNRRIYRITERGRRNLQDWLMAPAMVHGDTTRDELLLKLLFLGTRDSDHIRTLVQQERTSCVARLASVRRRRVRLGNAGLDREATEILLDASERRVRTDLAWLDELERRTVRCS